MERSLSQRMIGAALLKIDVYEEVEHDATATSQAAIVVGLAAVAGAIGALSLGIPTVVGTLVSAFLGWLAWAGITYVIGDKLFGGTATWGELLRTIGFAQAPQVLLVLAIIPLLGWIVRIAVFFWVLVAGVIAIRQALDFSTGRAVGTAILGWLGMVILHGIVRAVF